tara:strand:+ start:80 stop:307 length:228 start_codon:yes stop_codon:yes gene_type:complete
MNSSFIIRNIIKKHNNDIIKCYLKHYESRDFNYITKKNLKINNYYLTKEFKNYKPNLKKTNVLDDNYIKYLDSMK